jgi:hypothetical protein
VRKMQMSLLEKGNAAMAIWLDKNLLGQNDDGPARGQNPVGDFDDHLEIDP